MSYPSPEDERVLHERAVRHDPVVLADALLMFMDRISGILMQRLRCDEDTSREAAMRVIFSYIERPGRYDPGKGRLFAYLLQAAKYRALDQRRTAQSEAQRNRDFISVVEQGSRTPKEKLENQVEAGLTMRRLVERGYLKDERDQNALLLILQGERSTEELARALGLPPMPTLELRREVKRHRDRLMKLLERFGKEDSDDES
ncbi:RNA polymerase sigma factor [Archangium lansingense]|uniref:Sigma-70 family RNA polymerase sigma factor n=1 Tax=Archangium lansingense TaxID=2995310 RepID=A0ABT3ZZA6_9BACT|nr:sigma-70 family RNA polymerase sigma factor [Archangium lansinium]MCY1074747.1 sigma-70 family RNA polymerase sigma factor [Archangium lansinium]